MYSAFIPGSTTHTFQIPAVTEDGNEATWTASDPTMAQLEPQTFNGLNGVMITVTGTGPVTIVATESGGACGISTLNVTSAQEADWQIGNSRYNDGVSLHFHPPGFDGGVPEGGYHHGEGGPGFDDDGGSFFEEEGGTACNNCHGPTATNGPFKDVSHTPEQTGGFSDDDLVQIIVYGNVPDGGYFDPTVVRPDCDGAPDCTQRAYNLWHDFHRWSDITSDQFQGIVVYLRSLTPAPQTGTSNFGGHHHDGGGPHDGSSGPPPDEGGAVDGGSAAGD
jgi:hypothetical protein